MLDPNPENRALSLDEGDQVFFDSFRNHYNFSAAADQSLRDMVWVYPLLIEFFEIKDHKNLYRSGNVDA